MPLNISEPSEAKAHLTHVSDETCCTATCSSKACPSGYRNLELSDFDEGVGKAVGLVGEHERAMAIFPFGSL